MKARLTEPWHTLLAFKFKVLKTQSSSKQIDLASRFEFNAGFKSKYRQLSLNTFQLKDSAQENKDTIERVYTQRQYVLDAVVVRIMKTRKLLSHADLIREVFTQIQFSLTAQDIKKRIESLIEKEYLRRDEDNRTLYHYIS